MYGYMNTWIPAILVNARCNNDSKLLTNGRDTKNIAYYVASYAAKKQGPSYNTSAVFAEGFNYYVNHPQSQYVGQLKENASSAIAISRTGNGTVIVAVVVVVVVKYGLSI
jgi:hypothetical protein